MATSRDLVLKHAQVSNKTQTSNKRTSAFFFLYHICQMFKQLKRHRRSFSTQQFKSATSPVTGFFSRDAISWWVHGGGEEVQTGGQRLAGVFSRHCTQSQTTHPSEAKQHSATPSVYWERRFSPVSTARLRAMKEVLDARLAIAKRLGISSCQIHVRLCGIAIPVWSLGPRVTDGERAPRPEDDHWQL